MSGDHNALRNVLIIIGAIILGVSAYLLYGALVMVNYMAYYHCMGGMMCGIMMYYPLFLPLALLTVGIITVIAPIILIRSTENTQGLSYAAIQETAAKGDSVMGYSNDYYSKVLRLLPKAEREVLEYVIKSGGGEVFQYQIMKDLGLSKVRPGG